MKRKLLIPVLLVTALFFQACNNGDNDSVEQANEANERKDTNSGADTLASMNTVDEDDAEFMVEAASGGMMEVELGNMAQQKATNSRVKNFGEMMVRDHSKANEELKNLASLKNVTLPATMGDKPQKNVNNLRDKPAKDFDKSYINMMIDDHQEDIRKFERAANNAKSPDVKSFAAKTLPVLRVHLDSAKAIGAAFKQ
jgi:putative membrane protein